MCHHQSFLMDDCTTEQLEIAKKCVFSIFFASFTLKWPWWDLDMTLVLTTNKAQLVLMFLFAHKLRSCWCLHTNLTLPDYKIFLFFFIPPPPPQEFSGGDASVPRSSALKGLKFIFLPHAAITWKVHQNTTKYDATPKNSCNFKEMTLLVNSMLHG